MMMVQAKFCEMCGAKLQEGAKFCINCGAKLPPPLEEEPVFEEEPAFEKVDLTPHEEPEPETEEEVQEDIPEDVTKDEASDETDGETDYDAEKTMILGGFEKIAPMAILTKERTGETINIDKEEFILGKNPNRVDFAIRDNKAVSRVHASISWEDEGYRIKDLGSLNGTFVNSAPVGEEGMLLENDDVIELADEMFRLRLKEK